MKTSLTKLSSSFLLLSLSFSVWSKPVAQVTEVSGAVFMVTGEGKTSVLKLNQHVNEKSQVMVEEGATVTLNDYYDASYHLIGGSHVKFFNKSVQLKKGKAWVQSKNNRHSLVMTTANGQVNFLKSEFISTFDPGTSRSQVLVVNGEVDVSNILNKNMKYSVPAGSFTVMDQDGVPRSPTKVGLQSLNSALAEFKQLPSVMKETNTRTIASVEEAPVKKGEIIFIRSNRMPASVGAGSAHKYYEKTVKKQSGTKKVPIKFYGIAKKGDLLHKMPRKPASVQMRIPAAPKNKINAIKNDPEFTRSLKMHSGEQPKHPKEIENLLEDLRSF